MSIERGKIDRGVRQRVAVRIVNKALDWAAMLDREDNCFRSVEINVPAESSFGEIAMADVSADPGGFWRKEIGLPKTGSVGRGCGASGNAFTTGEFIAVA